MSMPSFRFAIPLLMTPALWVADGIDSPAFPPMALVNKVRFQDSRFDNPLAGCAFLVEHRGRRYACTCKHALWVAKSEGMKGVHFEGSLKEWRMERKDDPQAWVRLGRLLNEDRSEAIGPQNVHADWLVFEVLEDHSGVTPLKLRTSPLVAGETLYVVGWTFQDKVGPQRIYRNRYVGTQGAKVLMDELDGPPNKAGLSGGPVVDARGELVGIVSDYTQEEKSGRYHASPCSTVYFRSVMERQATIRDDKGMEEARRIMRTSLVIDAHQHDLMKPASKVWPRQVTFSNLKGAPVAGVIQALPLRRAPTESHLAGLLGDLQEVKARIESEEGAGLACSSKDFSQLHQAGKTAVMLAVESFHGPLEGNSRNLEPLLEAGVRIFGLASGGKDKLVEESGSLSPFAKDVISTLNQRGIACDLTHLSGKARLEAIATSRAPVMVSHTAATTVLPHAANLDDTTLDRIVETGGFIGLGLCSEQLSQETQVARGKVKNPLELPRAAVEALADHLDHFKRRGALAHVGIGTDFGGSGRLSPRGMESPEGLRLLVLHLLRRGYSEAELTQILGLNLIRYLERVESAAGI